MDEIDRIQRGLISKLIQAVMEPDAPRSAHLGTPYTVGPTGGYLVPRRYHKQIMRELDFVMRELDFDTYWRWEERDLRELTQRLERAMCAAKKKPTR